MRNMYDYAYEYEYQYHPERAGEMFAVVFASLWLAIMIGMLVFMLGSYLLHSFGLYTIAKRMGKKDAFVPFARTYYHGNMAGPIRLKNTTIKNPGLWKLLFPIIYSGAIGIYVLVLVFGIGMTLAGSAVNQNVTGAGMSVLAFFFMYFVVIIVSILFGAVQIALNVLVNKQIYENFAEGNMPVIHAVLSSLVPLYEAICLFIMRKRPFVR